MEWSIGMMCRLGYRGTCSMGSMDTLGDVRQGLVVVTLGGDAVG
jgi:hypothetical protein